MQQSLFGSGAIDASSTELPSQPLETVLSDAVFTVLDIETTGLSPKKNDITEITAIRYRGGVASDIFSTLVKPTEPIPKELQILTGITDAMVQNAPPLVTVLSDLSSFVGPSPWLVGHHVNFDIRFIQEKLSSSGLSTFLNRFDLERAICTRAVAIKLLPGLPSYEGLVVATHCGVSNPNPHRAEHDVRMCADILWTFIQRLKNQKNPIYTLGKLIQYQGPLNNKSMG